MEDNYTDEVKSLTTEIPDFKDYQSPRQTPTKEINSFLDLFMPSKGYFITPILIYINVLVFLLMVLSGANILHPGLLTLQKWGANFRPLTLEGEWWRLLTCCFLHNGIIHLIMNMSVLIYVGMLLEPLLGRTRFITTYLLTCIVSSLTSLCWYNLTTSAGASGAILGMSGAFLSLLTTDLVERRKVLAITVAFMVWITLIFGFLPHIDNAAHIGGLISGLIIGYAYMPGLRRPEDKRLKFSTIGILTFGVLAITVTVCFFLPSNIGLYMEKSKFFMLPWDRNNELIKHYKAAHPSALDEYILRKGARSDMELNSHLKMGIYDWDERKRLITKVDKSKRPVDIINYDEKMKNFISTEGMALDVYRLTGETSKEKLIYALKERGIYYWNENIKVIDEIDKLNLPTNLHERDIKLRKYCELRVKSYELMCKIVEKDNDADKALVQLYNRQIESLIKELKSTNPID